MWPRTSATCQYQHFYSRSNSIDQSEYWKSRFDFFLFQFWLYGGQQSAGRQHEGEAAHEGPRQAARPQHQVLFHRAAQPDTRHSRHYLHMWQKSFEEADTVRREFSSLLFCKRKNNSLSNPYIGLVGLHWYILLLVIAVQMLSKQDLYFTLENNCYFGVGRRRELTAAQQTGHNCRLHCNILCRAAQTEQWNGCNTWPGPLTYCLLLLRTNWVQWCVMGLLFIHCTIYSEPLSCIGPET